MLDPTGLRTAMLVLTLTVPAALVSAQEPDAPTKGNPWRMILEQQLKEKACDLMELLMFDEFKSGDVIVIEGKVTCQDGRQFNFSRPHPHSRFKIDLCEPAVC